MHGPISKAPLRPTGDPRAAMAASLHVLGFAATTVLIVWGLFVFFFLAIGGFSFDGLMNQLDNLARRYVVASRERADSFKLVILTSHILLAAAVAFFRRHQLFLTSFRRSRDHG